MESSRVQNLAENIETSFGGLVCTTILGAVALFYLKFADNDASALGRPNFCQISYHVNETQLISCAV